MLVMVLDDSFYKTYEIRLLGNVPQNYKNTIVIDIRIGDFLGNVSLKLTTALLKIYITTF